MGVLPLAACMAAYDWPSHLQANGADALLLEPCDCIVQHLLPAPADGHCCPMQTCRL